MNDRAADIDELTRKYEAFQKAGLRLDLTRGKPSPAQVSASDALDGILGGDFIAEDGTDTRNYGGLRGIPEARAIGARFLGVSPDEVIAGGYSSLTLMFYVLEGAMHHGITAPAWGSGPTRMLCPAPGYDRHFTLSDSMGMELITIPMTDQGPDMDRVEELVAGDPSIKGIWCVPKYSNPTGITYSDTVVRRIAALPKQAGEGFLVFWDNAYAVHCFKEPDDQLAPLLTIAKELGTADSMAMFASTSKVTFASAGVSFLGGSEAFLAGMEKRLSTFMIGADKVNQLRHARFLSERLDDLMQHHAKTLAPKFEAVEARLTEALGNRDIATWTTPRGGYFVSLDTRPGLASEVVRLAAEAGVVLTPAGATFPHGKDPQDQNIRIAPSFASQGEVEQAMDVLVTCIELATARAGP